MIAFLDHARFRRTTLALALAGAAAGLGAAALTLVPGLPDGPAGWIGGGLPLLAAALPLAGAGAAPGARWAGAAVVSALLALVALWLPLPAVAAAAGFAGLLRHPPGRAGAPRWASAAGTLGTAAAAGLGVWAVGRLAAFGAPAGWAPGVAWPALGAAAGWIAAAGSAAGHVRPADPVAGRAARLRRALPLELRALVDRIAAAHAQARRALGESPEAEALGRDLQEAAVSALDLAEACGRAAREVDAPRAAALGRRHADLRRRIGTAADPEVRASLAAAARELEGQQAQVERLRRARDRVWARLEARTAELERLRLSVAGVGTALPFEADGEAWAFPEPPRVL